MVAAQAAENHADEEAWPDTYGEGYIHQSQPESTYIIH